MGSPEYQIRRVVPSDFPRVAELLRYLTGAESNWNYDYLTWKYLDNPFVEKPLGIVAIAGSRVVGFRGYCATSWQLAASDYSTVILSPGDTLVDPQHRRKGLSVEMGRLAMREFHPNYRVFLNMTAHRSSVPGYLRMGFAPLQDKSRLTLAKPHRVISTFIRSMASPLDGVDFGGFGNLEVTTEPLPEEMAAVSMDPLSAGRLVPVMNEKFFRWYFRAPRRVEHVFYYAHDRGRVTGYVVLRVSASGQLATITDYSRQSFPAVAEILGFLARSKPFGLIWIYECAPDPQLRQFLYTLGFRSNSALEWIRQRMKRVWPFLVRPVKEKLEENDWFVEGLDIRAPSSWEIRELQAW